MRTIPLRHLAKITNSNVDKISDPNELPVRLCNYVDVYKNERITNNMDFMSASATAMEIEKFSLRVGDVIITKDSEDRSDIAVPAFVAETARNLLCGYHLALLRARPELVRGEFLFWAIQSKHACKAFSNAASGITRFGLALAGIKRVALPCPELESQKLIADFLDRETARIDQLIEKKERLIGVLKTGHASETLRVMRSGFDRIDYAGNANRISFSGLKSSWKRMRIKQLVRHMTSGSRAWAEQIREDGELFLQSGCITNMMKLSTEGAPRVAPQRSAEANRTRVKAQDILVCITGGRTGAVGFASEIRETAYINQHICLVRPDPQKIIPKLLAQILFSEIGQLQFRMAQYGLKQGLGFAEVANVVVPYPPREIQAALCRDIDSASRRLESIAELVLLSIDRLREFRSALITAAVTGQIDVTTWSRRGSTDRRLDQIEEEMST